MSYGGAVPYPVLIGFTGASTLTGLVVGSGTSAFTGNPITQYSTLIGGTSNAVGGSAPGAVRQVLLSNGSSANPTFQIPVGATRVVLSQQVAASSATIDFVSLITSSFNTYYFTYYNMKPGADGASLIVQYSANNGSSFVTTGYIGGSNRKSFSSTGATNNSAAGGIRPAAAQGNDAADPPTSGSFFLFNTVNALLPCQTGISMSGTTTSIPGYSTHAGTSPTTAINAVRFTSSGTGILTGTFTLYGIRES